MSRSNPAAITELGRDSPSLNKPDTRQRLGQWGGEYNILTLVRIPHRDEF
ncbi:hypothetical protein [Arthrobacter sp. H20]|nr:hypothetical protein [Arthrobacter sp. H20]